MEIAALLADFADHKAAEAAEISQARANVRGAVDKAQQRAEELLGKSRDAAEKGGGFAIHGKKPTSRP